MARSQLHSARLFLSTAGSRHFQVGVHLERIREHLPLRSWLAGDYPQAENESNNRTLLFGTGLYKVQEVY